MATPNSSRRNPEDSTTMRAVQRAIGDELIEDHDLVAVEEPLEIRIVLHSGKVRKQKRISVTMRTPGADRELAAGFLFTEGIVQSSRDVYAILPCKRGNLIRVHLRDGVTVDTARLKRNFYTSSSCGVCGKASIESVRVCTGRPVMAAGPTVSAQVIHQLPQTLRNSQVVFQRTGGLHGCALFDPLGNLRCVREDVGRHNALDKLIGHELLAHRLPLNQSILLVSGRASFELVQKAAVAGIPIMAAVGAPSSLAIELAVEQGITLLGFVRQDRFNIYSGRKRIDAGSIDLMESPANELESRKIELP